MVSPHALDELIDWDHLISVNQQSRQHASLPDMAQLDQLAVDHHFDIAEKPELHCHADQSPCLTVASHEVAHERSGVAAGVPKPSREVYVTVCTLTELAGTFHAGKDRAMSIKYDAETKAVTDHAADYDTEWAAITAISQRSGVSTESAREIRELKRKCRELEQTIEVLKAATRFFARECDPLHRDPTGRRKTRWGHALEPALNAFAITSEGRIGLQLQSICVGAWSGLAPDED